MYMYVLLAGVHVVNIHVVDLHVGVCVYLSVLVVCKLGAFQGNVSAAEESVGSRDDSTHLALLANLQPSRYTHTHTHTHSLTSP